MATAKRAALTAPALPMERVPTGIPPSIWAVESRESKPMSLLSMGTPKTGTRVWAAQTPAKWAAPPAAAMTTSTPLASAPETYSAVSLGVRCADRTLDSWATPNWFRVSEAFFMTSQSDLLPIKILTRNFWDISTSFEFGGERIADLNRKLTIRIMGPLKKWKEAAVIRKSRGFLGALRLRREIILE